MAEEVLTTRTWTWDTSHCRISGNHLEIEVVGVEEEEEEAETTPSIDTIMAQDPAWSITTVVVAAAITIIIATATVR